MRSSALVVAALLAVTMVVAPASTYTTGAVDRGSAIDVADDSNAVVGVTTPSPTQGDKFSGELATVSNRFDTTRTFTVTLAPADQRKYDLVAGAQTGDSVTLSLRQGEQNTIGYERAGGPANNRGNPGGPPSPTLTFTVETDGDVSATLTRTRAGQ